MPTSEHYRIPFDVPARTLTQRALEESRRAQKTPKPRAMPIEYAADRVRRQFFRDHPFEAFRSGTLVESGLIEDEHPIRGVAWTRLSQRGRNPRPEEYVIKTECHKNCP